MFLFIIYIFCNELVFKRLTKIIGNLFHFFLKKIISNTLTCWKYILADELIFLKEKKNTDVEFSYINTVRCRIHGSKSRNNLIIWHMFKQS